MTTGSRTSGLQRTVWGVNTGNCIESLDYLTKSWSGADQSPSPRRTDGPRISTRKSYQAWFGKYKGVQTWESPLPNRQRPPNNRGRYDDHAYSMNSTYINDRLWAVQTHVGYQEFTPGSKDGLDVASVNYNWTSNDDLNLIGKLREKVAGSDFNFGVFLGEGREACRMIGNSATRIYRAYRAARRGDFATATHALTGQRYSRDPSGRKVIANNWLELQYGWLPLLNDAEAGAQFLAHHFSVPLQKVVKVRRKKVGGIGPANGSWTYGRPVCFKSSQILARLKEKDIAALSGLTDPLSVAWELVPYSFVIDWFLPIGDYLQARGLASALTGTFVTSNFSYYDTGASGHKKALYPGQWRIEKSPLLFRRWSCQVSRSVSTSLSIPKPSVKGLGEAISWKRAANAVALLSQLKR